MADDEGSSPTARPAGAKGRGGARTTMKPKASGPPARTDMDFARGAGASDSKAAGGVMGGGGGSIRKTGTMEKQGHVFKTWNTRFFVLEGASLRYFTDDSRESQKGELSLEAGTKVTPGSSGPRKHCFLIETPDGKDLLVDAADALNAAEWVGALTSAVKAPSAMALASDFN